MVTLTLCAPTLAANDAEDVFESTSAALEAHERETSPETTQQTAQEVISQFFPEVEEDEGTYPPSEFVEQNFLLRRQGPAKGSYSGRFLTKYSDDQISGVEKFEKELELYLAYKDVSSYLRFGDVRAFARTDVPLRWEKGNVRFKHDSGAVTAGSYGALFGRGLALNMFEERFLDFDNEVEGIKVEQEVGEADVTALWGRRKGLEQFRHSELQALRWQQPLGDAVEVGAHAVTTKFPDDPAFFQGNEIVVQHDLVGGDITLRAGDLNVYAEAVRLERDATPSASNTFDFEGTDGSGLYTAISYAIPGFATTFEYKDYKGLTQPFSVLPPIRMWPENRTAAPDDDRGWGLDFNLAPFDDGSSFNVHVTRDNDHQGTRPFREFLVTYNSPSNQRTTYVLERWKVNFEGEKVSHHRGTVSQKLDSDWTVSTFVERKRVDLFGLITVFWTYDLEFNYGSKFHILAQRETSTSSGDPNRWGLYEIRYLPTEDQEIHLLVGSRREAFICSGGICRLEPAFDGVRVDWLYRFP